jgi:putative CocE/NonD family hydrolase
MNEHFGIPNITEFFISFHAQSFSEVNPKHKSDQSAWETPDPTFWTQNGYAIVRADERGSGQSPGLLDTMSQRTSDAFFDVIEWAAEQPWSSGKVGLLGISYYAGTQWRVAAQQPKGLAAIVPWEGMSDYYRDRCRHGGILSNKFIAFWWNRQVVTNQYGMPGRAARNWGVDTLEGDLPEDELAANRQDQTVDNAHNRFRDDEYYASKEYRMADIKVPLLSVANWGGILLHLRGNVQGWRNAGSELKYLRFITGRHDMPFYYDTEVEIQRSFLDAFLKDDDRVGWSQKGKLPPVDMCIRKGDPGHNNADAEAKTFPRRTEAEWPIARTNYTKFYLHPDHSMSTSEPAEANDRTLSYEAHGYSELEAGGKPKINDKMGGHAKPDDTLQPQLTLLQFSTPAFDHEVEITGHVTAHVNLSATQLAGSKQSPSEIDVFVTLRHVGPDGREIFYTGTAGDPVPLTKGWLRGSLRKIHTDDERNQPWLPHREYLSSDVQPVKADEAYDLDIEIWPTCCVVEAGGRIVFEIGSEDTQGSGIFQHNHPEDRPVEKLEGANNVHFGSGRLNYVTLPIVPGVN